MKNSPIYINGLGNVSPQRTTDSNHFLEEPLSFESNQLKTLDPGYKDFIPAEMIRRMSRIIKMGIAASKICLRDAGTGLDNPSQRGITPDAIITGTGLDTPSQRGITPDAIITGTGLDNPSQRGITPDAIITGTGLGCMEDTEKFLGNMIRNNEEFLTPTSFIQSTHNTVAGQIALLLKCHSYNFTYVHRGISFESALLDAMTQIRLGEFANALVGGSDELTANSFAITTRLGFWKQKPLQSLNLLHDTQRGSIAGEGASFLFLENRKNEHTYARLTGLETFMKPASDDEISDRLHHFLSDHGLLPGDIGLVILGLNGDPRTDQVYHRLARTDFPDTSLAYFKHLCGEYHTATAFAAWLAAMVIKTRSIPEVVRFRGIESAGEKRDHMHEPASGGIEQQSQNIIQQHSQNNIQKQSQSIDHVLIYNHFRENNHAFILLSRP